VAPQSRSYTNPSHRKAGNIFDSAPPCLLITTPIRAFTTRTPRSWTGAIVSSHIAANWGKAETDATATTHKMIQRGAHTHTNATIGCGCDCCHRQGRSQHVSTARTSARKSVSMDRRGPTYCELSSSSSSPRFHPYTLARPNHSVLVSRTSAGTQANTRPMQRR